MKRVLVAVAAACIAGTAVAADVGVSVTVGQPGFYGTIDIGNFPRPQVIYPEPVVVAPAPVGVVMEPLYLHVPPGHARNWKRHCAAYHACGRPVYFVQDEWYERTYVPAYRERYGRGGDDGDERRGGEYHDNSNHGRGHGRHGHDD